VTTVSSQLLEKTADGRPRNVAEVALAAPHDGTFRIEIGRGGFSANLASLGYDVAGATYLTRPPFCFPERPHGLTQDPAYFYIPKGTKSLDLEVWDSHGKKQVQLYRGLSEKGLVKSRSVDVGTRGTHRIALDPEETGLPAHVAGNGFAFPMLYSVPSYWSKCPAELLVPRMIAEADGLRIVE
jgi:hypothetical protein